MKSKDALHPVDLGEAFEGQAAHVTRSAIVTVRVLPELKDALTDLAAAENRPLSQYLELALIEHVRARGFEEQTTAIGKRRKTIAPQ